MQGTLPPAFSCGISPAVWIILSTGQIICSLFPEPIGAMFVSHVSRESFHQIKLGHNTDQFPFINHRECTDTKL